MSSVSQYFKGLFQGIGALLTGMSVTWKELFTKKITQQYPENRATLVISDRFRGELVMPHDLNNEHACTSCGICQMNCPNGTIVIKSKTIETEEGKKKKILDEYYYNLGSCTFCNLCVLTCPSDAIKFENTFESSVFTRGKLNMKLNHLGSKLREKKKPEPKPVAEKPAAVQTPPAESKPAAAPAAPVEPEKKENIINQESADSATSDNVTKE
ncbi:4Fe-4S binding protein [Dysgonomonas sp. GY617]|nr:4Fe-4S binding protein [Dysgonomonas sp. GY617]